MHAAEAIGERFCHPVPVVVHALAYYDQVAMQTQAAKPPRLAQECVDWVAEG